MAANININTETGILPVVGKPIVVTPGATDKWTVLIDASGNTVTLGAGANKVGQFAIDQTTNGTTNKIYVGNTVTVATHAVTQGTSPWVISFSHALPAGTNNIGKVDINTFPSLPAGANNIGDVDVLSLPTGVIAGMTSLPAGDNNIGNVDVLSLPSGVIAGM
jgi:hypothetical protein